MAVMAKYVSLDSTTIYGRGASNNAERAVDVVSRTLNPKRRDSRTAKCQVSCMAKDLAGSVGGKLALRTSAPPPPLPTAHSHSA